MTKEEWIELIKDAVNGGDAPDERVRRFHPVIIEKTIEVAFTQFLCQPDMGNNMKTVAEWKLDSLTKVYPLTVQCKGGKNYIELPKSMAIMKNQQHIRKISNDKDTSAVFVPRSISGSIIFGDLCINDVSNSIPYTVVGNRMYFDADGIKEKQSLTLFLVMNFSAFDYDEEVNIPGEYQQAVFLGVRQLLSNRPPEDNINDNNNNQV